MCHPALEYSDTAMPLGKDGTKYERQMVKNFLVLANFTAMRGSQMVFIFLIMDKLNIMKEQSVLFLVCNCK